MNIVHVLPALTKGGGERVVMDLAKHAAGQGHAVTILCAVPAPAEQLPTALDPKVDIRFVLPDGGRVKRSYLRLLPWMLANRDWLSAQDVVHVHLTFGSIFATLLQLVLRGTRRPVVTETYHAVGVPIPKWKRAFHTLLLGRRDAVAFMAEDSFWDAFRAAHPRKLMRTIPNGVAAAPPAAAEDVERYRRDSAIATGRPLIGTIGRLVPERRPDLVVRAFASLAQHAPGEVQFLLAGEGPERPRVEALARELGISDRLHMPGLVTNPPEPLALIDLYLTINVGPITGIAALEAAFAGLPILALQLRDDYSPGSGDWIWSSQDPGQVGRKAAQLIADPAPRAALAARQQAFAAAHYSVDAMAKAYYGLYAQALADKATRERGRD